MNFDEGAGASMILGGSIGSLEVIVGESPVLVHEGSWEADTRASISTCFDPMKNERPE